MATRRARRLGIAAALALLLLGGAWIGLRSLGGGEEPEAAPAVADPSSRRSLPAGEVVGATGRYGSHVWRGIPYAEPPVGERRWRAPVAAARWGGTREALAFGGHCVQLPSPFAGVEGDPGEIQGSEDCLYLNVYAPKLEPAALPQGADRLPVLVWIHGGGNVIGLADFYDGGALAARERVVVVTVNYRLGPFGWFRHAALREADADPAERSGNFGTLDLVRALEWVRDNVSGFGGDPERVTIFGESAGGTNVFTLLLAPQAAELFSGAIVQSGGTFFDSAAHAEHWTDDAEPGHRRSSNEIVARLLVADGRAADRAAARSQIAAMAPAELARFLRERSAEQLLGAYLDGEEDLLLDMPRVFADGAVLPAGDPLARFARADGWNRVPVVLGTNRDENKLFLYPQPIYTRQWFGFVPRVRDPELYLATADATSAMWKATGADGPADAMIQVSPDVFVYRFDWDEWPSLLGFDAATFLGAAHGFEIPFVFGHWDLGERGRFLFRAENRASREEVSDAMRSYWARFAAAGRPSTGLDGALPAWTAWDPRPNGHKFLILDSPAGGGLRMGSEPATIEGVLASVEQDPRLGTAKERCWVYRELASRGRGFARADYERKDCADYPYDEFPWD
jgi:para-nitrobenzyl esterase